MPRQRGKRPPRRPIRRWQESWNAAPDTSENLWSVAYDNEFFSDAEDAWLYNLDEEAIVDEYDGWGPIRARVRNAGRTRR